MKKTLKWIVIGLIVVFLVLQLFPRNLPEVSSSEVGMDLVTLHEVPENVVNVLKTSCYDCHSNETKYPWYSYVVPVNFLISHDIKEGQEELNFSEWGKYSKKRQIKKLDEIAEEMEEGEMPLPIYTLIHRGAKISPEELALIQQWTDTFTEQLLSSN